jgi:hypothetical protein
MDQRVFAKAEFLHQIISVDVRPCVISVWDDGDQRVWEPETYEITTEEKVVTVYMSDALYAAYCSVAGIPNRNARQPETH